MTPETLVAHQLHHLSTSLVVSMFSRWHDSVLSSLSRMFSWTLAFCPSWPGLNNFSMTTPSGDGGLQEASFTSPALSPKMARSSFFRGWVRSHPFSIFLMRMSPSLIRHRCG